VVWLWKCLVYFCLVCAARKVWSTLSPVY